MHLGVVIAKASLLLSSISMLNKGSMIVLVPSGDFLSNPLSLSLQIYEKLATAFKLEEDVVIANLDVDKYTDVAENYGVSGYPTLQFFPKGNKAGEDYHGERELDDFVSFINEKCGTSRDTKGQLTSKAGILPSLDTLVKEFVSASNDDKKTVLSKLEQVWKDLLESC